MTLRSSAARSGLAGRLSFGAIVHVNEKGGSFGGTEEYIALVTRELSRAGVRSHLVCGVVTGVLPPELDSVHVLEGLASRRPISSTGDQVAATVAALDPDVVFVHNVFDAGVMTALAAPPDRGVLLWYVHDHYLTCMSELRWRRDLEGGSCPQRLGTRCLVNIGEGRCVLRHPDRAVGPAELRHRLKLAQGLGLADGIVVVSDYMRSLLIDAEPGLAGRIHLVGRPVRDLSHRRPDGRAGEATLVAFAGRITPEKGLAVLLEAMGRVRTTGPIDLRIAGVVENAGYWAECERVRDQALAANPDLRVEYLGHLDYAASDELLRRADIVAVPSLWPEPLGAVALEAMAAGAAVLASKIGGLENVIVPGVNGVLIDPPASAAAWAAGLESLLRDPERARRLGERGHAETADLTVARHVDALDRIVAQARRAGAM